MPLRHIFFLLLLLVCQSGTAQVDLGDFERGLAAIEMGNPARAHELWLPLAESGNPSAQFGLSMMYMDGMGVEQDFDEAVYWLFKSADQGFPPAQFHLGKVYERGVSVKPDIQRAIHWWKLAADQGLGAAQYRLGQVYWDGEGVAVDKARARSYLLQAKANGEFISSDYRDALTEPAAISEPPPVSTMQTPSCASWLAAQPDSGYTLQMTAGQKQSSLTYFIKGHDLTESYTVCAYREGNRDWFGLFYGFYPTREEATSALQQLPADLKASQPYLRKISRVRQLTNLE